MNSRFAFAWLALFFWVLWLAADCRAQQTIDQQPTQTPEFTDVQDQTSDTDSESATDSSANTPQSAGIYEDIPQFGGPGSVGGQLAEDSPAEPQFRWQGFSDFFDPWFEFKQRINERRGLQFAIDESLFCQVATQSLGESNGASGLVRFYGQWEPFHRRQCENQGLLVFKIENRHRIATITPFDFGFEAGSITPAANEGCRLLQW